MNAIPQKLHNYQRVQMPQTPSLERTRPMPRIESLDAHRQARLNAVKRQELTERSRRMAQGFPDKRLDYSMAYRKASVPRNVAPQQRPVARKVTAAYEVKRRSYEPHLGSGYRVAPDGSLAARPKVPGFDMYAEEPAVAYYPETEREERPKVSRKGVVSTILCIALIFAMLAGVLMKYAELSNVTYQNAQAEKRIAQLEGEIDKANMNIALGEDLGSIQQRAAAMGMSYPSDSQVVYLPPDAEPAAAGEAESSGTVSVLSQTGEAAPVDTPEAAADGASVTGTAEETAPQSGAQGDPGYFENALDAFNNAFKSILG